MKRVFCVFLALLMMGGALLADVSPKTMKEIRQATCAIVSYFEINETKPMQGRQGESGKNHPFITVPLGRIQDSPNYLVAYVGAGTLLKDNFILTVRHMIISESGEDATNIYAIFEGIDHPIGCNVVAVSKGEKFCDDYAILKPRENIPRKGLKIAKHEFKYGEWIVFNGSAGGLAFFARVGHAIDLQSYFYRDDNTNTLHLGTFEAFPFLTVYPGGPGDSGGSIKNEDGEIIGLMYCGIAVYEEEYVFSNPLSMLKEFLFKSGLEELLE